MDGQTDGQETDLKLACLCLPPKGGATKNVSRYYQVWKSVSQIRIQDLGALGIYPAFFVQLNIDIFNQVTFYL